MQARKAKILFKEWAVSIVILVLPHWFPAKPMTDLRRGKSAKEEGAVGLVVPDEEQERVVAVDSFIAGP